MDCKELRALAQELEEGAAADIWYDAVRFGDGGAGERISAAQEAMISAARFLRQFAEIIE